VAPSTRPSASSWHQVATLPMRIEVVTQASQRGNRKLRGIAADLVTERSRMAQRSDHFHGVGGRKPVSWAGPSASSFDRAWQFMSAHGGSTVLVCGGWRPVSHQLTFFCCGTSPPERQGVYLVNVRPGPRYKSFCRRPSRRRPLVGRIRLPDQLHRVATGLRQRKALDQRSIGS
jgi:hypothetical protein